MSYNIKFRIKAEEIEEPVDIYTCEANITYNVSDIICKSTGLEWNNCEDNGLAKDVMEKIKIGLNELEINPEKYKKYEAPNGWGTVNGVIGFFETLLYDWKMFNLEYGKEVTDRVTFYIC